MGACESYGVRASPHGQALDEQSQGLFASVEAINDTLCANIVTE